MIRMEGPGHREEKGSRAGCGKLERQWEAGVGEGRGICALWEKSYLTGELSVSLSPAPQPRPTNLLLLFPDFPCSCPRI